MVCPIHDYKATYPPVTHHACGRLPHQATADCSVWTWHDAAQGVYAHKCITRTDGVWSPTPEAGHVSGRRTGGPVCGHMVHAYVY